MHVTGRTADGIAYEHLDLRGPWESTNGPAPVLLQHGIGLDRRAWAPWVRRLLAEHPVITVDLRGHGGSTDAWHDHEPTIEAFTGDLLGVLDARGVQRVHLVGESFGGTVCAALACALGADRVASLTTCSTAWKGGWVANIAGWPELVRQPGGVEAWSRQLVDARFEREQVPDALHRWVVEVQEHLAPQVVAGVVECLLDIDLEERAVGVAEVPTLNLVGQSPFVDPRHAQHLARFVAHVQNVFIPDSRHGIVLSHPETCSSAVIGFLRRHEQRGLTRDH